MKNVINIVMVVLLLIILLQMCNRKAVDTTQTIVHSDTMWIKKDSFIHSSPKLIVHEGSVDSVLIKEYLADTNYNKLLQQYNTLLSEYLAKNVYADSVAIDSIGYVHITDTVRTNSLLGRSFTYNLNYPVIHDSVIKYAPPTRQVYYGGGFNIAKDKTLDLFNTGVLYKDKQDRIYIMSLTINKLNALGVQMQTYWRLK